MADIVALGTVALDTIKTPFGQVRNVLGGSASYFSVAASMFARVGLVSVVGKDFPVEHRSFLGGRNINLRCLDVVDDKTFRWEGYYEYDMNEAHTVKTELNAVEKFSPKLADEHRKTKYLFLGNVDPVLQQKVLEQVEAPELVVLDTMNYWIENRNKELLKVIKKVNVLLLNEWEARELFSTPNLIKAAGKALAAGPEFVIIKKGEHGSLLFTESAHFSAPGYPLENLVDPTGAGDSFAGGFLGWIAKTRDVSEPNMRKAIIYGSAIASLNAEGFGLNILRSIDMKHVEQRLKEFREIVKF